MFKEYNPNPLNLKVSDCVVRAISKALKTDWKTAYMLTVVKGMALGDIMTANHVWGAVLADHDFKRYAIPNTCPDCYTIKEFAADHPMGVYVLGTGPIISEDRMHVEEMPSVTAWADIPAMVRMITEWFRNCAI